MVAIPTISYTVILVVFSYTIHNWNATNKRTNTYIAYVEFFNETHN